MEASGLRPMSNAALHRFDVDFEMRKPWQHVRKSRIVSHGQVGV